MLFGLKSARATYQGMITKMFELILSKTMDAYIDDMVVKSKKESNHIRTLIKVFAVFIRRKLRLNATKCAFGVSSEKVLGHLVTRQRIKPNQE